MIIDFSKINEVSKENFYGGNKALLSSAFSDGKNKIMYDKLEPGASIGSHTHKTNSEIMYILKGNGISVCDGNTENISEGLCHYCPKGHTHNLINNGNEDLIFFAVVCEQ